MRLLRSGRHSAPRPAARQAPGRYAFARSQDPAAPLFAIGAPLVGAVLAAVSAFLLRS